jgi:hypothetical protein
LITSTPAGCVLVNVLFRASLHHLLQMRFTVLLCFRAAVALLPNLLMPFPVHEPICLPVYGLIIVAVLPAHGLIVVSSSLMPFLFMSSSVCPPMAPSTPATKSVAILAVHRLNCFILYPLLPPSTPASQSDNFQPTISSIR